jgi:hypothetical protein
MTLQAGVWQMGRVEMTVVHNPILDYSFFFFLVGLGWITPF